MFPYPKPLRSVRLAIAESKRLTRREALKKANARRRRTDYGRGEGEEKWPAFKARILARDGYRCVVPVCGTRSLGVTVHHRHRVGSGGRNEDTNAMVMIPRLDTRQRLEAAIAKAEGRP